LDLTQAIPGPEVTLISPRVIAAYAALLAAATLGVLYLYRGRSFIVYWIGAWLMFSASALLTAQVYADQRLSRAFVGLALLLVVWGSGLLYLAAEAFPDSALRWTKPLRFMAGTAAWFLAVPLIAPIGVVVASGAIGGAPLVGWAAFRYLRLSHTRRYAGAFLIGAGLIVALLTNLAGAAAALQFIELTAFNRVAAVNIITIIFMSLGMHLLVFEDMTTELRRANEHLATANHEVQRLAITDPLTGCHNRRFFDEIQRREILRHRRYGTPLSVVFVDVDRFKQVNDTIGHDAGDDVLRVLGTMLRRQVRESDYVIRWGGDEFVLLLTCGEPEAHAKAQELKATFVRERLALALPPYVALSVGVAGVPREADSLADAIRVADTEMYRDKVSTAGS
jgi:diguanylate cyclase (GGDEF)-like protein